MSTLVDSRSTLTNFLNHLPSIPNHLIKEGDRICSICWEPYSSDASGTSSIPYPNGIRSSASKSCATLITNCPFPEDKNLSTSDILVKTEIWVERELLAETYTRYLMCDRDGVPVFKDDGAMSCQDVAEEPVRLRCGHIFGRNCLRIWFVFFHYLDFYSSFLSHRLSGCPGGDAQDTCPLCRDNIFDLGLGPEREYDTLSVHRQNRIIDGKTSRLQSLLCIVREVVKWTVWKIINRRYGGRRNNGTGSRRNDSRQAILSLNVR